MEGQVYTVRVTKESTEWCNAQGKFHRLDGPARESVNGGKEWWINGERMTEWEFLAKTQPKELTMDEIAAKFGIPVEQLKIKKG